jgi:hypothetical protein
VRATAGEIAVLVQVAERLLVGDAHPDRPVGPDPLQRRAPVGSAAGREDSDTGEGEQMAAGQHQVNLGDG